MNASLIQPQPAARRRRSGARWPLWSLIVFALVAAAASGCFDSGGSDDDSARFCNSLVTLDSALADVDALDADSSARDAASARDIVQDAYHDLADGTVVLENSDDPPPVDIDGIGEDIEDLLELLTEVADGEPISTQLTRIDGVSADIARERDRLAQIAGC